MRLLPPQYWEANVAVHRRGLELIRPGARWALIGRVTPILASDWLSGAATSPPSSTRCSPPWGCSSTGPSGTGTASACWATTTAGRRGWSSGRTSTPSYRSVSIISTISTICTSTIYSRAWWSPWSRWSRYPMASPGLEATGRFPVLHTCQ